MAKIRIIIEPFGETYSDIAEMLEELNECPEEAIRKIIGMPQPPIQISDMRLVGDRKIEISFQTKPQKKKRNGNTSIF